MTGHPLMSVFHAILLVEGAAGLGLLYAIWKRRRVTIVHIHMKSADTYTAEVSNGDEEA